MISLCKSFVNCNLTAFRSRIGGIDKNVHMSPAHIIQDHLAHPVFKGCQETRHADGQFRITVIHGLDFKGKGKRIILIIATSVAGHTL